MKAELKNAALHSFLGGKSLREVATEIGVHRSTVERWSRAESWVALRKEHQKAVREKFISENFRLYQSCTLDLVDKTYRLLADAVAERVSKPQWPCGRRKYALSNCALRGLVKNYVELRKLVTELDAYKSDSREG